MVRVAAVEELQRTQPSGKSRQPGVHETQKSEDAAAVITNFGTAPFAGIEVASNARMNCADAFVFVPEKPYSRVAPDFTIREDSKAFDVLLE
jgi:hypothetical protein